MELEKIRRMKEAHAGDMLKVSKHYAGARGVSEEEAIAKEGLIGKYKATAVVALQDANYRKAFLEREEIGAFIEELNITDEALDGMSYTASALECLREGGKRE